MSHPVLYSAVRLSRPRAARASVPAASSPALAFNFSAPFSHTSYRTAITHATSKRSTEIRPSKLSRVPRLRSTFIQPRSPFSSASSPAAQVTQNPRTDDDGNTLMIGISERAANRLRQITDPSTSPSATKDENPYHHLRITVTSGGCHGFQYLMSLEAASKIHAEEDTIFEAEADSSAEGSSGGNAKVVMDEPSLELLSGSTVDYTTELIGSQFKIVDNPRATSSCGCGTSFDVVD
ncbi:Putative Iron-sulfur cluster assembly accessory protein [Aspergillus calidoustus]|uniref:Putative Iron-sulfur cluster assembly accessory protein n=1 Tax=Aspergillus calidoustus TaxID=454130 RepID=A0A0U5FRI5_ASPCI|nr:Putative Iron-sulfur cluster assembly accessory protein [Aspergillus calidoustus]